jgi:hypothetical protein
MHQQKILESEFIMKNELIPTRFAVNGMPIFEVREKSIVSADGSYLIPVYAYSVPALREEHFKSFAEIESYMDANDSGDDDSDECCGCGGSVYRRSSPAPTSTVRKINARAVKKEDSSISDKYEKLACDVAKIYKEALDAAQSIKDNGPCNMNSIEINLPRWNSNKIAHAWLAKKVPCGIRKDIGGNYCLSASCGKAARNTALVESMEKLLKKAGYDAHVTYEID